MVEAETLWLEDSVAFHLPFARLLDHLKISLPCAEIWVSAVAPPKPTGSIYLSESRCRDGETWQVDARVIDLRRFLIVLDANRSLLETSPRSRDSRVIYGARGNSPNGYFPLYLFLFSGCGASSARIFGCLISK